MSKLLKVLLLLLLSSFFSHPAKAVGTYIQSCTGNATGSLVGSCTLNGVAAGDFLVLVSFNCGNRAGLASFVSDSFASSWSYMNASSLSIGDCDFRNTVLEIDYAPTTISGNDTVFVNSASGNLLGLAYIFAEYSGVTIPVVQDPPSGATFACLAPCANPATGNLTTTAIGDLLVAAAASRNTLSTTAGYTARTSVLFNGGAVFPNTNVYLADKTSGAAGTYNAAWTMVPPTSYFYGVLGSFECPGIVTHPCSNKLIIGEFNLTIPPGSSITGVSFKVGGHQDNLDPDALIYVQLHMPDGSFSPTTLTLQLPASDGTVTVGSSSELWGETLTPEIVNDPLFGVSILALTHNGEPVSFSLYGVTPTVWYF